MNTPLLADPGTVTAASNWDAPAEFKRVRLPRVESYWSTPIIGERRMSDGNGACEGEFGSV
jgi:hypothetical protein